MYFENIKSLDELRKLFHKLCLKMHPDKGGDHIAFVEMKHEYERIAAGFVDQSRRDDCAHGREPRHTMKAEREIMEMIEKIVRMHGLLIELCGSWLWLSGETYSQKDAVKSTGFRWSTSKKRWYWSPYMTGTRRGGRGLYEKRGVNHAKIQIKLCPGRLC